MPVTTAPPARPKAAPAPSKKSGQRQDALLGLGQIAQMGLIGARQYADAGAVGVHWPNISREVATLADTDARIAAIVDPLLKAGPYTALVAAVLPLVAQIGVNHKVMPAGAMGTVSGDMLEAQIKTGIAQQELQMRKAQQEAEKELLAMTDAMTDHAAAETGE